MRSNPYKVLSEMYEQQVSEFDQAVDTLQQQAEHGITAVVNNDIYPYGLEHLQDLAKHCGVELTPEIEDGEDVTKVKKYKIRITGPEDKLNTCADELSHDDGIDFDIDNS